MLPRAEFPNPQMERTSWLCLNGPWQFTIDGGDSGEDRGLPQGQGFDQVITVPFAPESPLSGIGCRDFMPAVWYARTLPLTAAQCAKSLLLTFGAVDYRATLWVNGQKAGEHRGGSTPFAVDIRPFVKEGGNLLVLRARDDTRSGLQPCGKQSTQYASNGCVYTRTTGIWQSVYLQLIDTPQYIRSLRVVPDAVNGRVSVRITLSAPTACGRLTVSTSFAGKPTGSDSVTVLGSSADVCISLSEHHLWSVGDGQLYDMTVLWEEDGKTDTVQSYFGLRQVALSANALLLNGQPLFQRLVLDQGFFPDGVWTAPTADALEQDIRLSMAMGFNGARLHQKVFEPRYLYAADKLGYLVWGEFPSWGADMTDSRALEAITAEWVEVLERDASHPCVITWALFNETVAWQNAEAVRAIVHTVKAIDPTRPIVDASGWTHVDTDILDLHDYEQDAATLQAKYADLPTDKPIILSEYGGMRLSQADGWGYGDAPADAAELLARITALTAAIAENPAFCGFCYTQLTDVEQEQNGLLTYERQPKLPAKALHTAFTVPAALTGK